MPKIPRGARWGHIQTITPWHMDSVGIEANTASNNVSVPASSAFPSGSTTYYFPVYLQAPVMVVKLFWITGGTANGNMDVGIVRVSDMARIVSTGAVAQGTINVVNSVDVADTYLYGPDTYLLGCGYATGTGTLMQATGPSLSQGKMMGFAMEASATIPATATPVATNSGRLLCVGMAFRTLIS